MTINIEDYLHYLEGRELTREQKEEIIRIVVNFMQHFVDCAFDEPQSK